MKVTITVVCSDKDKTVQPNNSYPKLMEVTDDDLIETDIEYLGKNIWLPRVVAGYKNGYYLAYNGAEHFGDIRPKEGLVKWKYARDIKQKTI